MSKKNNNDDYNSKFARYTDLAYLDGRRASRLKVGDGQCVAMVQGQGARVNIQIKKTNHWVGYHKAACDLKDLKKGTIIITMNGINTAGGTKWDNNLPGCHVAVFLATDKKRGIKVFHQNFPKGSCVVESYIPFSGLAQNNGRNYRPLLK
jgi:hypothetical protein